MFFLISCNTNTESQHYYNTKISNNLSFDRTEIHYSIKKDTILKLDTLCCPIAYIRIDDTLAISVGNYCKTNLNLLVTVSNKTHIAYADFNSDYNEYYGKHSIKFKADKSVLELSKSDYKVGDTLYGKIETGMFAIPDTIYFKHIDSISFKGNFVAIIDDYF